VAAVTAGMGAHRQRKLERAGIRLEMHTMAGPALVLDLVDEDGETVRTLVVDGTIESATYLGERRYDLVFDYLRTFDAMFDTGMPISNALMIGGGGYSYPKHLVFHHPETAVDVVEGRSRHHPHRAPPLLSRRPHPRVRPRGLGAPTQL